MSAHVARKHPDRENPLRVFKQNRPFSAYLSPQPQNRPPTGDRQSNSAFDPPQVLEKTTKFQKILQEIRQMDKMEVDLLLLAINKIHFTK